MYLLSVATSNFLSSLAEKSDGAQEVLSHPELPTLHTTQQHAPHATTDNRLQQQQPNV